MADKDQTPPKDVKDLGDGTMQNDTAKDKGAPKTGDKSGQK